jgi:hypothetical protein
MERYALNLKKRYFCRENYATITLRRGFGSKNRNLRQFSPNYEVPKSFLDRVAPGCGRKALA